MLKFGFDNFKMIPLENFLLTNGEKEITVQTDSFVDENWHCKKYPLRKDGSETLVVKIK